VSFELAGGVERERKRESGEAVGSSNGKKETIDEERQRGGGGKRGKGKSRMSAVG
jgi:hypothetical protein